MTDEEVNGTAGATDVDGESELAEEGDDAEDGEGAAERADGAEEVACPAFGRGPEGPRASVNRRDPPEAPAPPGALGPNDRATVTDEEAVGTTGTAVGAPDVDGEFEPAEDGEGAAERADGAEEAACPAFGRGPEGPWASMSRRDPPEAPVLSGVLGRSDRATVTDEEADATVGAPDVGGGSDLGEEAACSAFGRGPEGPWASMSRRDPSEAPVLSGVLGRSGCATVTDEEADATVGAPDVGGGSDLGDEAACPEDPRSPMN
ncbi:hypothetical protein [Streptomyces spectabilis]|uniref:Uncharacterized protein n=1 Tax=Streptomyces spectabilis TaxID=68270 RepID=A0A5P2WY88_STRST|nr:hypothetical protein [Streptomyces spectabilis]MBB5107406.1 hypothetical protein [Streptomyces spectabilis]MCI3900094.1 hypothetical protein [Streptomyces spectabilis]QEV57713.1 hypothetical protein CP982_02465 [Streptomyces spectabilis]